MSRLTTDVPEDRPNSRFRQLEDPALVAGSVCLLVVSLLPVFVAPVLAHVFMDKNGMTASMTGILIGLAQGGLAVGALGSAPLLKRWSGQVTGLVGAVITGAGWLALAGMASPIGIGVVQAILGLGAGLASAAGNGVLAQARSPVRAFSIATISVVLTGSILVAVIPDAEGLLPGHGLFVAAAAVVFLCVVTAVGIRPVRRALVAAGSQCKRRAKVKRTRASSGVPVTRGSRISGAWVALVVTMLMAAVGNFAVWTFVEEIGISLGMAEATTIRLLSVTQIIGLAGALVAAASGGRVRRVSLLPPALLLLAVGNLAIGLAGSPMFFVGGMIAVNVAFYCLNPLLFAKSAQLDPVGRLAAVVGGASLAGSFVAPVVGGFLAGSDHQWARLSWTAALVILLALGPATFALRGAAGNSRRVGTSEG